MFIKNDVIYIFARIAFWVFLSALISTLFAWYVLPHLCEVKFDYVYITESVTCGDSALGGFIQAYFHLTANLIIVSLVSIFAGIAGAVGLITGKVDVYTQQTSVLFALGSFMLGSFTIIFYLLVLAYTGSLLERGIETIKRWRKR